MGKNNKLKNDKGKRYSSFDDLAKDFVDDKNYIMVEDKDTGEEKKVKTVSRAELSTIMAYMVGVNDEKLDQYYSYHYNKILIKLHNAKDATIIRYLCRVRTCMMLNYEEFKQEYLFKMINIDRSEFFHTAEIKYLQNNGVNVVLTNTTVEKYITHINDLINKRIDNCKHWFPDSVKYEYIRGLFVVPGYNKAGSSVLLNEWKKFKSNINYYPFQNYIYWHPEDKGYLFKDDLKFLYTLYGMHGDNFVNRDEFTDINEDTKEKIYEFIRNSKKIIMVVDCENSDPYKLMGVLTNLNATDVALIDKIFLYDDTHTTMAWDYIKDKFPVPVEHIEVERIVENKSIVDGRMIAGITREYYKNNVESFILCSSDSDFAVVISELPEAHFMVLYEEDKCGSNIKLEWDKKDVLYCCMDDFYLSDASSFKEEVLLEALEQNLTRIVGVNMNQLTRSIFMQARIKASNDEMNKFCSRYIKTLKLAIDEKGDFYIDVQKN